MSFQMQQLFLGEPEGKALSGETLRDWGIEDALDRAERVRADYVERCIEAIRSFPYGAMITIEDVRERAGDPPNSISPNAMAGILKKAASQKLLVCTSEMKPAKRVSAHSRWIRCWRRL